MKLRSVHPTSSVVASVVSSGIRAQILWGEDFSETAVAV